MNPLEQCVTHLLNLHHLALQEKGEDPGFAAVADAVREKMKESWGQLTPEENVALQELSFLFSVREPNPPSVTFTINGKSHTAAPETTYEALVELAGMKGNPSAVYSCAHGDGMVTPGKRVLIRPGTRFTIMHTGNA